MAASDNRALPALTSGSSPSRHQSSEIYWTSLITKQGDSMVRKLLYEAATRSSRAVAAASPSKGGP
ncbi:transposase [Nitratireductor aquimarinus]|nr:transposase [Nitratireductor aquimarinus]